MFIALVAQCAGPHKQCVINPFSEGCLIFPWLCPSAQGFPAKLCSDSINWCYLGYQPTFIPLTWWVATPPLFFPSTYLCWK